MQLSITPNLRGQCVEQVSFHSLVGKLKNDSISEVDHVTWCTWHWSWRASLAIVIYRCSNMEIWKDGYKWTVDHTGENPMELLWIFHVKNENPMNEPTEVAFSLRGLLPWNIHGMHSLAMNEWVFITKTAHE